MLYDGGQGLLPESYLPIIGRRHVHLISHEPSPQFIKPSSLTVAEAILSSSQTEIVPVRIPCYDCGIALTCIPSSSSLWQRSVLNLRSIRTFVYIN